jgi:hypothetical protein
VANPVLTDRSRLLAIGCAEEWCQDDFQHPTNSCDATLDIRSNTTNSSKVCSDDRCCKYGLASRTGSKMQEKQEPRQRVLGKDNSKDWQIQMFKTITHPEHPRLAIPAQRQSRRLHWFPGKGHNCPCNSHRRGARSDVQFSCFQGIRTTLRLSTWGKPADPRKPRLHGSTCAYVSHCTGCSQEQGEEITFSGVTNHGAANHCCLSTGATMMFT